MSVQSSVAASQSQQRPAAPEEIEAAEEALKQIRELRRSAKNVFRLTSAGVKPFDNEERDKTDAFGPAKAFYNALRSRVDDVSKRYSNLQKHLDAFAQLTTHRPIALNPALSKVVADSAPDMYNDQDMDNLYEQTLTCAHRSEALAVVYSFGAERFKQQHIANALPLAKNTSYFQPIRPPASDFTIQDLYRQRLIYLQQQLKTIRINEQAGSQLLVFVSCNPEPIQPAAVPVVQTPGPPGIVMKCIILLKPQTYVPQWFLAKGPTESFGDERGRVDLSIESRHVIFRRLSATFNALILNSCIPDPTCYDRPHLFLSYLEKLLKHLAQYSAMFQRPCGVCNQMLQDMMPPYIWDRRGFFHHEGCRKIND